MKYNPYFTHWCQEQHFDYIKSNNKKNIYILRIQLLHTGGACKTAQMSFSKSETDASTSDEEEKDPVMRKERMKAVCEY